MCGSSRCPVCKSISITEEFTSLTTKKTYKINLSFDCNNKCLIYLLSCRSCGKQYVGNTTDPVDGITFFRVYLVLLTQKSGFVYVFFFFFANKNPLLCFLKNLFCQCFFYAINLIVAYLLNDNKALVASNFWKIKQGSCEAVF